MAEKPHEKREKTQLQGEKIRRKKERKHSRDNSRAN